MIKYYYIIKSSYYSIHSIIYGVNKQACLI